MKFRDPRRDLDHSFVLELHLFVLESTILLQIYFEIMWIFVLPVLLFAEVTFANVTGTFELEVT